MHNDGPDRLEGGGRPERNRDPWDQVIHDNKGIKGNLMALVELYRDKLIKVEERTRDLEDAHNRGRFEEEIKGIKEDFKGLKSDIKVIRDWQTSIDGFLKGVKGIGVAVGVILGLIGLLNALLNLMQIAKK